MDYCIIVYGCFVLNIFCWNRSNLLDVKQDNQDLLSRFVHVLNILMS